LASVPTGAPAIEGRGATSDRYSRNRTFPALPPNDVIWSTAAGDAAPSVSLKSIAAVWDKIAIAEAAEKHLISVVAAHLVR